MEELGREDRMRLMKFVCSFAWADLEVQPEEKVFITRLVDVLELTEDERSQVESWVQTPPPPEEVDPAEIPKAHRQVFIDTIRAMIVTDGRVDKDEAENFSLLEVLTAQLD